MSASLPQPAEGGPTVLDPATAVIPAQAGPSEPRTPVLRPLTVGGVADLPRVNLLPPEVALAKRTRTVKAALVAGVAASVLVVGAVTVLAGGAVGEAQDELALAQARGQALDREVIKLGDVSATYARVRADQEMLATAMGSEVRWSRYLNDLSLTVPDGVWITQMTVQQGGPTAGAVPGAAPAPAAPSAGAPAAGAPAAGAPAAAGTPAAAAAAAPGGTTVPAAPVAGLGTVTVSGMASDHDAVATWLEALAGQHGYTDPYFSAADETTIGSKEFVRFTSTVTVTAQALSGCYTLERTGC